MTQKNGIGDVYARMEGYDSTVLGWVASPPFSAGTGGAGSTQVAVSSLAGKVTTNPYSTSWADNAGFHFNSSGELQVVSAGGAAGSTQVSISTGNVTVQQGTNPWVIAGNSTVVQGTSPWITAGASTVAPLAGSTWNTRPVQSSAADLQMTATPAAGSTWNVRCLQSSAADFMNKSWTLDGVTGAGIESSTRAQGTNSTMRGMVVRSACPDSTFASGLAASSGNQTVLSSGATQVHVFSVVLGWAGPVTTNTKNVVLLQSGAGGAELFRATFQIGAANTFNCDPYVIAVTPPAYLFRTAAGALLNLNGTSSGATYCVSAWRE